MTITRCLAALVLLAGSAAPAAASEEDGAEKPKAAAAKTPASVYEFKVKDIDGKDFDLAKMKGKVTMVVNVASR